MRRRAFRFRNYIGYLWNSFLIDMREIKNASK